MSPFAAPIGPPKSHTRVTPSDSIALGGFQYLYVVTSGTLSIKGLEDSSATDYGSPAAGAIIPFGDGYVMSTGTTAVVNGCK